MPLTADELAAVERVRSAANGKGHPYCEHDYNIHRWITAYGGDEEEAATVLLFEHSGRIDLNGVVDNIRKDTTAWREIYAGCERPALPQVDTWRWRVPHDGYYYIRYGNEKAWLFSVTVRHLIYQLKETEKTVVTPISTFVL
ncbi:hypothetical protein ANCDUO_17636 [Ancylostoma duodenale]|uniref:Ctg-1-like C-terminal domain-containing protein n=1 Tax=Ancylostoma duodenale TaxID=51022 RepID=A0A0C2C7J3_9BILA|nr:hypothetical protein ANCDUO_17636 [Ancylostoma duodenale]